MIKENFPIESWLLQLPLYKPVTIDTGIETAIQAILLYKQTMDSFCPECQQSATFRAEISESSKKLINDEILKKSIVAPVKNTGSSFKKSNPWKLPTFSKTIVCTRAQHFVHFHFISENNTIIKIGQYPSLADLAIGNTKKYKEVLGVERLKELNKAMGLAAHGIGIGSYVYLRRIFESLIEEARQQAKNDVNWDEENYQKKRMKEKIPLLENFLPQFILSHPELYSILSLGIHELTEEQCLANFEALKQAILVIADERLHDIERKKRYSEASQAVKSVSTKVVD